MTQDQIAEIVSYLKSEAADAHAWGMVKDETKLLAAADELERLEMFEKGWNEIVEFGRLESTGKTIYSGDEFLTWAFDCPNASQLLQTNPTPTGETHEN